MKDFLILGTFATTFILAFIYVPKIFAKEARESIIREELEEYIRQMELNPEPELEQNIKALKFFYGRKNKKWDF